jgi:hypothetical protein
MHLRVSLLVLLTAAALAFAPSGAACEASSSQPEVDTCNVAGLGIDASNGGCVYIDNDVCQPECLFSVWIYCESNGMEGLQRGDEVRDDTCNGAFESDVCMSF